MTQPQNIEMYAAVLRQLLPPGSYDNAPQSIIAADIYGHAAALSQVELNAQRILSVIENIPNELLAEFERDYGLPLKCSTSSSLSIQQRINLLNEIISENNVINKAYLSSVLNRFSIQLNQLITYKPMQCISPCNAPVNTEQLRYKVTLKLQSPVNADMNCIIKNYLPAFLRIDALEV